MQSPSIEPKLNVVWQPIQGTSQELALSCNCNEILYTGTRGPGKSDTQLMRFRKNVGVGYGSYWRGIIFDREYKHLDDLVSKSKRWFMRFNDGARFLESTNSYKWVWPTGEELMFRVIKTKNDYEDYHGQELPFIGWNELTKYPNHDLYDMMLSCNRSSFTPEKDAPINPATNKRIEMNSIPLEVFSTTNSWGPGHMWVKRRFIDVAPYGKIVKRGTEIFNPKTKQQEIVTRTQVAIFGSYRENPYLDPLYIAGLANDNDPNRRAAWLHGSWDVTAGGAFDDLWRKHIHVIPRFKIPKTWWIDRSFDWGSTKPFSVQWWAESNGEEATMPDGSKRSFPPGTLFQIYEYYGTRDLGSNEGLKLSAKDIAQGIIARELLLMKQGWIEAQPFPGPADNQIRESRESDIDTIEKKMADQGVRWTLSDKSPGSRIIGMQLYRDRLEASIKREGPGLYVFENCVASIMLIPVLPRDEDNPDDVDTEAEDHPWDATRYRVLSSDSRKARVIKTKIVH